MPWNYFKPKLFKSNSGREWSPGTIDRTRAQTFHAGETRKNEKVTPYLHFRNAIFVRKNDEDDYLRPQSYRTFQILILGIPGVGKTSILERFLKNQFFEEYNPTASQITHETQIFLEIENKLKRFDLTFRDFAGDLKTQNTSVYRNEIETSDGFVLVHTKNELESFPTILELVADIKKIKKRDCCILALENKCDDLCYYGSMRSNRRSFDLNGCINAAVSAKTNKNVSEAIAELIEEMEQCRIARDDIWC